MHSSLFTEQVACPLVVTVVVCDDTSICTHMENFIVHPHIVQSKYCYYRIASCVCFQRLKSSFLRFILNRILVSVVITIERGFNLRLFFFDFKCILLRLILNRLPVSVGIAIEIGFNLVYICWFYF